MSMAEHCWEDVPGGLMLPDEEGGLTGARQACRECGTKRTAWRLPDGTVGAEVYELWPTEAARAVECPGQQAASG